MKFAPLPMPVKRFVTMCLARYDSPTEVAQRVRDEFNLVVGRSTVARYDPTRAAGAELCEELRTLFRQTREAFADELEKLPLAHRATRLRRLESVYDEARTKGDRKSALAALALAAKEMQPFEYQDVDDSDNPDEVE
ncbi:DUF2280 domain-containing protein [Paraburkholderia xenovorans]|uniref:DUF2280 domain-containing protein n=1 Tax=Paraburkholderia xenovorans TaxID=36873 RepID=UPI001559D112|nr:DUF2280 domain-containing protein [Paraburkholderia xenovorans]NPT33450.1 DUF2280 domain-containing protein [Paraburkholderia xenovorans]